MIGWDTQETKQKLSDNGMQLWTIYGSLSMMTWK